VGVALPEPSPGARHRPENQLRAPIAPPTLFVPGAVHLRALLEHP
jgi:hypothetical protein